MLISLVKEYLLELQNRICLSLEKEDGSTFFKEDEWSHAEGGGGITRVLINGDVIEKCGVNYSHISGKELPIAATSKRPELLNQSFQAQGVSVVIHPRNPYAPTSHFNVRFIYLEKAGKAPNWWFGGGFDLTPYYGFAEDCRHWHSMAKMACEPFGPDVYPTYKKACDDYFYLKHRKEPRGIGGLFFDDLNTGGFEHCFKFMQSVSEHFIQAYQPILAKRKRHAYGEAERHFQAYRRGRYVEFNLLYDRGTLFGLQSGGRVASILMSLPPIVAWPYGQSEQIEKWEQTLVDDFLNTKHWL